MHQHRSLNGSVQFQCPVLTILAEHVRPMVHAAWSRVLRPSPPPLRGTERGAAAPLPAATLSAPVEGGGGDAASGGGGPLAARVVGGAGGASVSERFLLHLSIATRQDSSTAKQVSSAMVISRGIAPLGKTIYNKINTLLDSGLGIFPCQRRLDLD